MKEKTPEYFRGADKSELKLFVNYICDCIYLQNLAVHAMSHKGKRESLLLQMEEGAKTLIKHVEKIKEIRETNNQ